MRWSRDRAGGIVVVLLLGGGSDVEVGVGGIDVVGGGGREAKEAERRWCNFVVSERICFGMRQVKGTIEEKKTTVSYTWSAGVVCWQGIRRFIQG